MPKFQWKGDNKLCIPTLESGKIMPGAVFEMDADSQKLAGVQKLIRDRLIVPYQEPAPAPVAEPDITPPAAPEVPPAEIPADTPEQPAEESNGGGSPADTIGAEDAGLQPEKSKPGSAKTRRR